MTKIVILGAGFGGVSCALNLVKKYGKDPNVSITLVDRHDYHLFHPNLYEVATAEEEFVSPQMLKKSITVPLREIFAHSKISLVKGEVLEVDQKQREVTLPNRKLEYDFLILALGSASEYFGIDGAEKNSLPLKDLKDALRIKNKIEFAAQMHRQDPQKKTLRFLVAGGGYTGAEFVAELSGLLKILSWKYQYPREKMELEIVEASNQLVGGFSPRLSRDAYARLSGLNVRIRLLTPIVKVDDHFVYTLAGEKISYDVLVWTVGVRPIPIPFKHEVETDKKGHVVTNASLQVKNYENIFVAGDLCGIIDEHGVPSRPTAQDALRQGKYIAQILPLVLKNKRPKNYTNLPHGFVVSLGGKWAIMALKKMYAPSVFGYFVGQAAHFRYYMSILGFWGALKHCFFNFRTFGRND